jgi:hypothetical protein
MPAYVGHLPKEVIEDQDATIPAADATRAEEVAVPAAGTLGPNSIVMSGHSGVCVVSETIGTASVIAVSLEATGVIPGYYRNAQLGVNADGRIFSIESIDPCTDRPAKNLGSGSAVYAGDEAGAHRFRTIQQGPGILVSTTDGDVVISVDEAAQKGVKALEILGIDGIRIDNGIVNEIGRVTVGVDDTGVIAGAYENAAITVDAKGRVVSAKSGAVLDITAKNIGEGDAHVFAFKNQSELQFRTLRAGHNIKLEETGTSITISAANQKQPAVYTVTVRFDANGSPTIDRLPTKWKAAFQGTDLVITHALAADIMPTSVTVLGQSTIPGFAGSVQTMPTGRSRAEYAFTSSGQVFTIYNFDCTNTATSAGGEAVVNILVLASKTRKRKK